MIKKTYEYKDLEGRTHVEDHYFALSKAELAEWELTTDGGMREYLTRIVEEGNPKVIIAAFKDLLMRSYGKRSEDGRRFIKSDALSLEFMQTEAYSELFIELVTDAKAAAEFVRGIVPGDLSGVVPEKVQDKPSQEETYRRMMEQVKVEDEAQPVDKFEVLKKQLEDSGLDEDTVKTILASQL